MMKLWRNIHSQSIPRGPQQLWRLVHQTFMTINDATSTVDKKNDVSALPAR